MNVTQQHSGARHCIPGVNLQARELFQGEHPTAEGHPAACHAPTRAGNRHRNSRRGGLTQDRGHRLVALWRKHSLRVPALQPGSVFQITGRNRQTSRITGMINGRLDVCFTMCRFRSARIFSFMTPQSVFSS